MTRRAAIALLFALALFLPVAEGHGAGLPPELPRDSWVPNDAVDAVAQSGDQVFIGGAFSRLSPPTGSGIAFSVSSGARDTGYPEVGGGPVYAVVPDGVGGWYIGGDFSIVDGQPHQRLAHIRADKTVDPSFNPGANGQISALAVSGSTLYVGGAFSGPAAIGGESRTRVAAIDRASGEVTEWDPGAEDLVHGIEADGGHVYIAGPGVRRYSLADGTEDEAWSPDLPNGSVVRDVEIAGSQVYLVGDFEGSIDGNQRRHAVRVSDSDGTLDVDWNPDPNNQVLAVEVAGPTVYLGGAFNGPDALNKSVSRSRLGAVNATDGAATAWNPTVIGDAPVNVARVRALVATASTVYVGGTFTSIGGEERSALAAIDAGSGATTSWSPDPDREVAALGMSGGTLYVGGEFLGAGGVARTYVAAVDSRTGQPTDWDASGGQPWVSGVRVTAIEANGGAVYIAGNFDQIGSAAKPALVKVDALTGAPDNGFDARVRNDFGTPGVGALASDGSRLYVGGGPAAGFDSLAGKAVSNLGAVTLPTGADAMGTGPWGANSTVNDIEADGTILYAVGDFSSAGGATRRRAAAISTTSGGATGWNPNLNASAKAIAVGATTVFVGGAFTTVNGGAPRGRLAALNRSNGLAQSWTPAPDATVSGLALGDQHLFVGGAFSQIAGNSSAQYLAAFNLSTLALESWDPDLSPAGFVNALDDSGGALVAGGRFSAVGGVPLAHVAVFGQGVAPVAALGTVGPLTQTAATLSGTVDPRGEPTTYRFDWGTTPAYGDSTTTISAGSGNGPVAAHAGITGLTAGATYHYRLVATSSAGATAAAGVFTTPAGTAGVGPKTTVAVAGDITATTARLTGTVDPEGVASTSRFEWGTDPDNLTESSPDASVGSGSGPAPVEAVIDQLLPGTVYHFRLSATSALGTNTSAGSFTTLIDGPGPGPVPALLAVSDLTETSATLNGSVDPQGTTTTYRFDYGPTIGYGSSTPSVTLPAGAGPVAVLEGVSALTPATAYFFRLVASSAAGTNEITGTFRTFSASGGPGPETVALPPLALTETTATLNGTVDPRGEATLFHFEWGLTPLYGNLTPIANAGVGTGPVPTQAPVEGLTKNTLYYFRLVGASASGTSASPSSFVTPSSVPGEVGPGSSPGAPPPSPGGPAPAVEPQPVSSPGGTSLPAASSPTSSRGGNVLSASVGGGRLRCIGRTCRAPRNLRVLSGSARPRAGVRLVRVNLVQRFRPRVPARTPAKRATARAKRDVRCRVLVRQRVVRVRTCKRAAKTWVRARRAGIRWKVKVPARLPRGNYVLRVHLQPKAQAFRAIGVRSILKVR